MRHKWWSAVVAGASLGALALSGLASASQASTVSQRAGIDASGASAPRVSASGSSGTSTHRVAHGIADGRTGLAAGNPFCKNLGKKFEASSGAQMFCFGSTVLAGGQGNSQPAIASGSGAPVNVNAASPAEDVAPDGARMYGQSETSIAAAGRYVVEAWNDSTTFVTQCNARDNKAESTGLGFSANGGHSFTDLGGLPNPRCAKYVYASDPSVVAYQTGGKTYFYISSMLDARSGLGLSHVAFDACQATGIGAAARLHCAGPVIAGSSKQCVAFGGQLPVCSFLDKDFMTIDPARGRLYVSYSEFPVVGAGDHEVMSMCTLGDPVKPTCHTGTRLVLTNKRPKGHVYEGKPYFTVAGSGFRGCENEGAYPAVNVATGSVYVAYEYNWATNVLDSNCFGFRAKTQDVLTRTPLGCLRAAATASCAHPANVVKQPVTSIDGLFLPGYSRFPASDFPRIAVSSKFGTVSMVWNDTRYHPYGDILLQSFRASSLARVQRVPVVLDQPHGGGVSMLPGLRVADANGLLDVGWYSRSSVNTVDTNLEAAIGINPLTVNTPPNVRITGVASNWADDSSDINPNFGDYTDAVIAATGTWPYVGNTVYFAWSDGRSGVPQPFEAHMPG